MLRLHFYIVGQTFFVFYRVTEAPLSHSRVVACRNDKKLPSRLILAIHVFLELKIKIYEILTYYSILYYLAMFLLLTDQ